MATKIAFLRPIADIDPLWTPTPDDGSAYASKIDESVDLADGDVSKLSTTEDALAPTFLLTALPEDLRRSTQVRLRAVAKSSSASATTFFVPIVNDVALNPGPDELGYDWANLPLNTWVRLERIVTVMPVLRGSEVLKLAFTGFAGGATIAVTAVELEVTYKTNLTDFTDVPTPTTQFTKLQV